MSARHDLIDEYGRAETGTAPWTLAEFQQRLAEIRDEARDEALLEAAEVADAEASRLYDDMGQKAAEGARAVAARLRAMADEGRPAPGGAPDFFRTGHTYTDGDGYTAPELTTIFRVEHVTRHPDRGSRRAIGWARSGAPGASWHGFFRDEDQYDGWTNITDPPAAAQGGDAG
ncbi:hypothetical protein [Streptomyces sp. NPDC047315]|uniref:hypothetical protein n=1 Tax=Streptomyces sp. NPDC047315 TaxID=3155142 RepID=UPI0034082DCD